MIQTSLRKDRERKLRRAAQCCDASDLGPIEALNLYCNAFDALGRKWYGTEAEVSLVEWQQDYSTVHIADEVYLVSHEREPDCPRIHPTLPRNIAAKRALDGLLLDLDKDTAREKVFSIVETVIQWYYPEADGEPKYEFLGSELFCRFRCASKTIMSPSKKLVVLTLPVQHFSFFQTEYKDQAEENQL